MRILLQSLPVSEDDSLADSGTSSELGKQDDSPKIPSTHGENTPKQEALLEKVETELGESKGSAQHDLVSSKGSVDKQGLEGIISKSFDASIASSQGTHLAESAKTVREKDISEVISVGEGKERVQGTHLSDSKSSILTKEGKESERPSRPVTGESQRKPDAERETEGKWQIQELPDGNLNAVFKAQEEESDQKAPGADQISLNQEKEAKTKVVEQKGEEQKVSEEKKDVKTKRESKSSPSAKTVDKVVKGNKNSKTSVPDDPQPKSFEERLDELGQKEREALRPKNLPISPNVPVPQQDQRDHDDREARSKKSEKDSRQRGLSPGKRSITIPKPFSFVDRPSRIRHTKSIGEIIF